jgi:ribosome-associated heat shock protein Hsp15
VRVGDRLEITLPGGRRTFVVKALADHHIPKKDARELYEETTPVPPPEVQEARRLERLLAPRHDAPGGRLSHRERRERERLRGS